MRQLKIVDGMVQVATFFERPIAKSEVAFAKIADQMISAFPSKLNPDDIALTSDNDLFDFELTIPLFNRSADVTLTSGNVTSSFREVTTTSILDIIAKSSESIFNIFQIRPVLVSQITLTAQAKFTLKDDYQSFIAEHAHPEQEVHSGGVVMFATGKHFDGEVRFGVEKSLTLEDSLFASVQFATKSPLNPDIFLRFRQRFNELAEIKSLQFILG